MARNAMTRAPAAPRGQAQAARRARILRAAADLGARHSLDEVQMLDVAREAGVAIGTLYRYFPSKMQLYVAVMSAELFEKEGAATHGRRPAAGPVEEVGDLLIGWMRRFTRRRRLGVAMVQSTLTTYATPGPESDAMDLHVAPIVLSRLAVDQPGASDLAVVRLLVYAWWGIVIARISEHLTQEQAEAQLRLGASLLLADYR